MMKTTLKQRTWAIVALSVALPMGGSAATLTWDNGGGGSSFATAGNWNPDQSPSSGNDTIVFDTALNTSTSFLGSEFTIGNGQTFSTTGPNQYVFRIGNGGDLTIAEGGTFDFSTSAGLGILAEAGTTGQRLTIEGGATARADRFFNETGWTTEFVANASGVTTFEITNLLFLRAGPLELNLTNYDISNGDTLVLFDYAAIGGAGAFSSVAFSPLWSGTIDYAYDIGGGDLGIAVTNLSVVPEPSSTALLGLGGLALLLRRRR